MRLTPSWSLANTAVTQATRGVAYAYALLDVTEAVACARAGDGAGAATHSGAVGGRLIGAGLGIGIGCVLGSVVATPKVGGPIGAITGSTLGSAWGEQVGRQAGAVLWQGVAHVMGPDSTSSAGASAEES